MSLKKQAVHGTFWALIQQFSTQGISIIVSIILARLLLPSEFGLIAMIGIFMGIGNCLLDAGLGQSLIRTPNADQDDFSTVFFFNLIGSIFVYIMLFFAAPLISQFYHQEILTSIIRIYCLTIIISAFGAIQKTRLTQQMNFKTELLVALPSLVISSTVGIYLAFTGHGVWSLVWSSLVQSVLVTIQFWYHTKWRPSWVFNKEKFKYHFSFGVKLTVSGLIEVFFLNLYTLIIGKFYPPAQVGFYNRADSLQQLPVVNISAVLSKVTYPLFASIQNDDVRLKVIYKKIMQMVVFIIAPILLFMAILATPLFSFLFTDKWLPAVPYFQILCFGGVLYPIHSYNLHILNVKGRSDLFLKLEIFKKIMVVIVILISFQFGIYGLLYSTIIISILAFFINTHYSGKFLNYPAFEQSKDLLPILFLAIVSGIPVFLCQHFLIKQNCSTFFQLILGGLIGIFTYIVLAFLLKFESLTELKNIIKRND